LEEADPTVAAAAVADALTDVTSAVEQYAPDASAGLAATAAAEAGRAEADAAVAAGGGVTGRGVDGDGDEEGAAAAAVPPHERGLLAVGLRIARRVARQHRPGASRRGAADGGDARAMVRPEERLALLSIFVWAVALGGLLIAIGWNALDYVSAQRNPAVGVVVVPAAELQLPVLSFCSGVPGVPAFVDGKGGGVGAGGGLPLLTIRRVHHVQTGEVVAWPPSGELVASPAYTGGDGCAAALRGLHMGRLARSSAALWAAETGGTPPPPATPEEGDTDTNCRACVQVGLRRPVVLRDPAPLVWGPTAVAGDGGDLPAAALNPAYRVEVVASRALSYCTRTVDSRSSLLLESLLAEIGAAADAFVAAGVLSSRFASGRGPPLAFELTDLARTAARAEFDVRRAGANATAAAAAVAALATVQSLVCSVHFFSGVLYPVTDDPPPAIAYRYEAGGGGNEPWAWVPVGAGPYWTPPPPPRAATSVAAAAAALDEGGVAADAAAAAVAAKDAAGDTLLRVYATDGTEVAAAHPPPAAAPASAAAAAAGGLAPAAAAGVPLAAGDRIGAIPPQSLTTFGLDKLVDDQSGARWSPSTTASADVELLAANSWHHFWVELRVGSFIERTIERRPATSTTQFLAAVVELLGLFTGLCIYSIVVLPAQMVARKKRMDARAVARERHTVVRRE